jgi:SSS family solute:Na+ symporter
MFWKNMNANGALTAAVGSAVLSLSCKFMLPNIPFMDRVGLAFLLCLGLAIIVSKVTQQAATAEHDKSVSLDDVSFETTSSFNILAGAVIIILIAFYAAWW